MGHRTGTRNTGRAKAIGGGILAGLAALGEAAHDGPRLQRIDEIDDTIVELRRERDYLINELYEPGDLTVSDDYDRYWRPKTEEARPLGDRPVVDSDGERFVDCPGRDFPTQKAHPACPWSTRDHIAHDFKWDGRA